MMTKNSGLTGRSENDSDSTRRQDSSSSRLYVLDHDTEWTGISQLQRDDHDSVICELIQASTMWLVAVQRARLLSLQPASSKFKLFRVHSRSAGVSWSSQGHWRLRRLDRLTDLHRLLAVPWKVLFCEAESSDHCRCSLLYTSRSFHCNTQLGCIFLWVSLTLKREVREICPVFHN
jgi:hypothetical protein